MTLSDRLSPDQIARDVGLVLKRRHGHRATAYTDLLQPAVDLYWQRRKPNRKKAAA